MLRSLGCLALVLATLSCDGIGRGTLGVTQPTPGASKLAFTVQPSNATLTTAISPPVVVTVQNDEGATATSSTVTVTMLLTEATGTAGAVLNGTVTSPAINGVATFNNLRLDRAGDGYTLTAVATGLTTAVSASFNVTP